MTITKIDKCLRHHHYVVSCPECMAALKIKNARH